MSTMSTMSPMTSIHNMTTRSKSKDNKSPPLQIDDNGDDSVDEHGNLKGFIDYDCEDEFDHDEFDKQVARLSGGMLKPKKKKTKKIRKNHRNKKLNDVFMKYLIMKATEKANEELKMKHRNKNNNIQITEGIDSPRLSTPAYSNLDDDLELSIEEDIEEINLDVGTPKQKTVLEVIFSSESDDDSFKINSDNNESDNISDSTTDADNEDETDKESNTSSENISVLEILDFNKIENDESSTDGSEEYSYEYDEEDEKYEELIDKHMLKDSEESNMEYYHHLDKSKKEEIFHLTKEIYEYNGSNVPLRFKVIESEMDMKTKAIALENIDKMAEMDVSTGEHSKMDHWINGLMKIPFGKYNNIPVNPDSTTKEKREFIQNTYKTLDKAIYGHKEAKTHMLQVIGKWMKNPESGGNVLAIQGPMGNGKTTLVKEGISKVLNRPFHFIALGGASDSAYFDGHCYTYEGSHWGRIVQILQESKCMNPIIYFDELDKISDTTKGDEIIHMLTHLTDPSQNSLFQDNYFPGINLDLSKALFIFSYNDESKVNKILKDRMYVIHTKGFKTEDKIKICNEYLIPEIFDTFAFEREEIVFTDEIVKIIIEKHTEGEQGVRNLKRCIETIISKINIHILSHGDNELSFNLEDLTLPVTLNEKHIEILLKKDNSEDKPPYGMYL
jgi:ATP-dependent Lon protease